MRLFVSILGLCFLLSSLAMAQSIPKPAQKPILAKASEFLVVLDKAAKPTILGENKVVKSKIITPPPLPLEKVQIEDIQSLMVNGIPIPQKKPLVFLSDPTWKDKDQTPRPPPQNATIDLYNQQDNDERTAGDKKVIERKYASRRPSVRETSDKSPFKTAQLPRAQKLSRSDPVIIFFKENSSELEVGQIDIIKSDIVGALNRSPNQKVAIYGYAERQTTTEKTNQLSLSRALLISEFIAENRIAPNRIEARSMGNDTPIAPKNRVDVVLF